MGEMGVKLSATTLSIFAAIFLVVVHSTDAITCYHFTWPGDKNDTDCDETKVDPIEGDIPCKYPLVYTEPRHLPPDIDDLNDHCSKNPCPKYTCSSETQICVKWAYYDVTGKIYNYTSFCGTVADVTKEDTTGPVSITDGCWDEQVGTFKKHVCACDIEDRCNSSSAVFSSLTLVSLLLLIVMALNRS